MMMDAEDKNLNVITAKYREFVDRYSDLMKIDEQILKEMASANLTEEQEDAEMNDISSYRQKMEMMRINVEKLNPEPTFVSPESVNGTTTTEKTSSRQFKLPRIELQKFTGDIKDWLRFWAQFQKIDEDPSLMGSDKFWYLLQSLEPRSEAYEIVTAYPQSNENYPEAVQALKKRFGDEDLLLQVYIRELLTLVVTNVTGKEKIPLQSLYLKVDAHLRALKTLKLEKADPATWLFPLVESSLPEDVLYNWQRNPLSTYDGSKDNPPKTRLDLLMDFVEKEVGIQTRMEITRTFGNNQRIVSMEKPRSTHEQSTRDRVSRAKERTRPAAVSMGFHVREAFPCIFCGKINHESKDCRKAKNEMSYDDKMKILRTKGLCFNCFLPHRAIDCRSKKKIHCSSCGKGHHSVICRDLPTRRDSYEPNPKRQRQSGEQVKSSTELFNSVQGGTVYLQTLLVRLVYNDKEIVVRAFLDGGAQRSYLLKSIAYELGLIPKAEELVSHVVFGGDQGPVERHLRYDLRVKGLRNEFQTAFEVRDKDKICGNVPRMSRLDKSLIQDLKKHNVELTDIGKDDIEIGLLIGNNMYARLLTGKKIDFANGLTALETYLGWTLSGEMTSDAECDNMAEMSVSMAVQDSSLTKLWELDTLGIVDPDEYNDKMEGERKALDTFRKGVNRNEEGRYVVKLPWKEGHPILPTYKETALKRLETVSKKLEKANLLIEYENLFHAWEKEKFIERVEPGKGNDQVHYLPHRGVIKPESLTTPVRPVFDASCKRNGSPSLNDCLHTGENYIQLIPDILLRFREKAIGFVSDIRKAFQMIEVHMEDRDALRFLWKDSQTGEIIEYRHARVPFGATCSPFILGAILKLHLESFDDDRQGIGKKLLDTFYVDNCCSSEDSIMEYHQFREKAVDILAEAQMDLRMWLSNVEDVNNPITQIISVLGMRWDRRDDTLFVNVAGLKYPEKITKRVLLSIASKIFDPIGVTSPGVLPVKIILQRTWIHKMKWDEILPVDEQDQFKKWFTEIAEIGKIRIPRVITGGNENRDLWELHSFSDSSKVAYGSVLYLKTGEDDHVSVQLLSAKSRVAPMKKMTIPRLELLSCLIGARLTQSVKSALSLEKIKTFYWSDSSTALAWIRRNNQWGTFVGRRTEQILKLSEKKDWYHIPGKSNPADLPSRGCGPSELLRSQWWRGPSWLKEPPSSWPGEEETLNEAEIENEQRKTPKVQTVISAVVLDFGKQYSFATLVRIQGWVKRFIHNISAKNNKDRQTGRLIFSELQCAERDIILKIQSDTFTNVEDQLTGLECMQDEFGVLRIKTRLTYREDEEQFKFPAVLPGKHPVVQQLITDTHRSYCHAGVGFLMTKLRKKYWIIKARQNIRRVTSRCYRCRRYAAKATITTTAPLPADRIKDAEVFEILGVDLAGPFILKNQKKVWLVIYTCAVYRAVHLQLISSLTTTAFIKALGKFVERFRRPAIIYSDNGTNFRGADKLFKTLDWKKIQEEGPDQISWKFNPASAAWWGGWWERLIRTVKDLLRKTVGKGSLAHKEFEDVLGIITQVMNERPLTYVTENPEDLEPLTPELFLHPLGQTSFPESELLEADKLRHRYDFMKRLKQDLRNRFRNEYLGMLVSRNPKKNTRPLKVGDLVFVGNDRDKRTKWPLGKIMDLYPGQDGVTRVARVKTGDGVLTRPVQRLFALEADSETEIADLQEKVVTTRSGRVVKRPRQF